MEETKRAAAYVPWRTFTNSLDRFRDHGLPNRIDRSVFVGQSGGTQNQLVAAMKFLGLIGEDGNPSEQLRQLAGLDELQRKEPLREVFETSYAKLFELDLAKASPDQLNEVMAESYNVSGSTRQKAVRFFLSGAKDLGVEISPFLEKAGSAKVRTNGPRRQRKKKAATKKPSTGTPEGTSRTVGLASGGELTVSASLDLFSLSASDRSFIFELIDRLEEYEKANEPTPATPVAAPELKHDSEEDDSEEDDQ